MRFLKNHEVLVNAPELTIGLLKKAGSYRLSFMQNRIPLTIVSAKPNPAFFHSCKAESCELLSRGIYVPRHLYFIYQYILHCVHSEAV